MQDFKINTGEALFTLLNIEQFSFESLNGYPKEKNQELFQQIVNYMPLTEIKSGTYFRSRKINEHDGEDTGIIRKNGLPISGYNAKYSGVAPIQAIRENGRVNRIGEQVLYLAENIETSCKELKTDKTDYISVSECTLGNKIKVMDFTITVSDGLANQFSNATLQYFKQNYSVDIRAFYIGIKKYLTSPSYKDQNYVIPLNFLDIAKKRNDISGVKYNSFYTDNYNIALWDENKNSKCTNGKVIKGQ